MSSAGAKRLHAAMQGLAASIADLETFLITSRVLDDIEIAAGYRFILGIQKYVMDRHFLGADTQRPRFIKFMDEFSQWGLGNPDNTYWSAQIEGGSEYIVTGERGTITDICVELRTGIGRRESGEHSRTLAYLDIDSLSVDGDGKYRVHIGGPEQAVNWLPCPSETEVILVRQTFNDWDTEKPMPLWIERAGPATAPAPPPSEDLIASRLEDAARRLNFIARINDEQIREFRDPLLVNAFSKPDEASIRGKSKSGFFPGQHNAICWWSLLPGQAIVISLSPPECRYLGLMIGHPIWFSALDFANRQNSLNLRQVHVTSDGLVHYVIAATDPGVPNWIDPGHLCEGFVFFRCQGLTGTFDIPEVRVLDLGELRDTLPSDTPTITAEERNEVLKRRRIAVQRRFL